MMKCKICGGQATIQLPHFNMNLCEKDFLMFLERRTQRTIEKFQMFKPENKLLLAVSGGKDSISLWYILTKLGYNVDGVFIQLGNDQQVKPALDVTKELAQQINRTLIIEDARKYLYGLTTFEAARLLRIRTCSFCGKVKRYLMNKVAYENGYDVLITGHNLDDEASLLLGNILHWQSGYFLRSHPVLEPTHPKLVKKVKPHCLNYEKDILTYTQILNLPYLKQTCPFSIGAKLPVYKNLLDKLELEQPNIKTTFYKGFLKEKEKLFRTTENQPELKSCKICGYPTMNETCSFCSSRQKIYNKLNSSKSKS